MFEKRYYFSISKNLFTFFIFLFAIFQKNLLPLNTAIWNRKILNNTPCTKLQIFVNESKIMTKCNFLCIWPVNIEDVCISNSLFILERFWKVDKFLSLKKGRFCCFLLWKDFYWLYLECNVKFNYNFFFATLKKKSFFLFQKEIRYTYLFSKLLFFMFSYIYCWLNPTLEINNHTPNFLNKVTIRFIFTK